jgi:hypothetical protein
MPELVEQVVGAVFDLTGDRKPPYWVSVDRIIAHIGVDVDADEVNAALQSAIEEGLLRSDGGNPPFSVCVIHAGIAPPRKKK